MIEETMTGKIWLHMLSEGGRWTIRELAMDLKLPYDKVKDSIMRMYDSGGSVLRHAKGEDERAVSYSVGERCRLPMGVTLMEVRRALQSAGETV